MAQQNFIFKPLLKSRPFFVTYIQSENPIFMLNDDISFNSIYSENPKYIACTKGELHQCCGTGAGDGAGAGGNYFEELKLEPEP